MLKSKQTIRYSEDYGVQIKDDLLNQEYGEEVPVTLINGQRHDYFKVDRERFKNAILRLRQ